LKKHVSADAWPIYLRLEQLVNDRIVEETATLLRWAFNSRRRSRR
jgi:hypothetical protein